MNTIEDALTQLAQQHGWDADELINYSYEDDVSGWDNGLGGWPIGSLWTVEGRYLYALVRKLQPEVVVEIGTNVGCGATHIASALKANGNGKLVTLDINKAVTPPVAKGQQPRTYRQGELIPDDLLPFVEIVNADGIGYLLYHLKQADLIFEDGAHSVESTREAWQAGVPKLSDGGFMISHDAAHFVVGEDIRAGIEAAGITPQIVAIAPSDCGLAVWRKSTEAEQPIENEAQKPVTLKEIDHQLYDPFNVKEEPFEITAFIPSMNDVEVSGETLSTDELQKRYPIEWKDSLPSLDDMTVRELRAYAKANGIQLGQARNRDSILEKIRGA